MKNQLQKKWVPYVIAFVIGLLMACAVLEIRDYSAAASEVERLRILSDAMTVPGLLLILFGALVWVTGEGVLNGLTFVLRGVIRRLIPGARNNEEDKEGYYEYVMRKRAKKRVRILPFLVVGACYMLVAIYFIARFYQVFDK